MGIPKRTPWPHSAQVPAQVAAQVVAQDRAIHCPQSPSRLLQHRT